MVAKRRRPATASRKISSRLPARSVASVDRPVTFPPGRAKLATRLLSNGVPGHREHDWNDRCGLLCRHDICGSRCDDDIDLKRPHHFNVASSFTFKPPARLNTIVSEPLTFRTLRAGHYFKLQSSTMINSRSCTSRTRNSGFGCCTWSLSACNAAASFCGLQCRPLHPYERDAHARVLGADVL